MKMKLKVVTMQSLPSSDFSETEVEIVKQVKKIHQSDKKKWKSYITKILKGTVTVENIFLYVFMHLCIEQLLYRIKLQVAFLLAFLLSGKYL